MIFQGIREFNAVGIDQFAMLVTGNIYAIFIVGIVGMAIGWALGTVNGFGLMVFILGALGFNGLKGQLQKGER